MGGKKTEACGRCSMSTVVDLTTADGEGDGADRSPFADGAIEVDDDTLRKLSPGAYAGRVKARLDDVAQRIIYGR